jgi:hypothetical protein
LDEESKTYWIAVARLRRDGNDEAARSMLRKLSETGTGDGVRRSAAQQLRRAIQEMSMSLSLIGESERVIDAMRPVSRFEQLEQWAKRSRKARMRAALLLLLMAIIWVVLQFTGGR